MLVSNVVLEDYDGDLSHDSDSVSFDGILSLSANAVGNDGQTHQIAYSVNISASAEYSWETDERPTGWNYKTDSETYTTSTYAAMGDTTVHLIEPDPESVCYYDGEEVSIETLQQNLSLATQKQLLNPKIISDILYNVFESEIEKLEPPSKDDYYDEPDDYYDRDYDDRDY